MNRYKIHRAVEYIKTQAEFPFDGIDVEDSLDEVLAYFGLHPQLDDEERELLQEELLPLAVQDEEAEVCRMVELATAAELADVKDRFAKKRRTPEGVLLFFYAPVIEDGLSWLKRGVFPFNGENTP